MDHLESSKSVEGIENLHTKGGIYSNAVCRERASFVIRTFILMAFPSLSPELAGFNYTGKIIPYLFII